MAVIGWLLEFCAIVFSALLYGFCTAILSGLTFFFIRNHPFAAIILTAIFLVFHLDVLKQNLQNKSYFPFIMRILAVCICISAPASLVWLAFIGESSNLKLDLIDAVVFIGLILSLPFLFLFFSILNNYFRETDFVKKFDQIIRGAEKITGLKDFINYK